MCTHYLGHSLTFSIATSSVGTPCSWLYNYILVQNSQGTTESSTSHIMMWWSMTTTEDWHPIFGTYSLYITIWFEVWIFCLSQKTLLTVYFVTRCKRLSFSFLLDFSVWLFVVEIKILKNNAYSIQKLWMGEWRCQLYVHYMFWCNQKHWEYVVLCCKNKSISDIAVLLLKIKPLQNLHVKGSDVSPSALCRGFLSSAIISCLTL